MDGWGAGGGGSWFLLLCPLASSTGNKIKYAMDCLALCQEPFGPHGVAMVSNNVGEDTLVKRSRNQDRNDGEKRKQKEEEELWREEEEIIGGMEEREGIRWRRITMYYG